MYISYLTMGLTYPNAQEIKKRGWTIYPTTYHISCLVEYRIR